MHPLYFLLVFTHEKTALCKNLFVRKSMFCLLWILLIMKQKQMFVMNVFKERSNEHSLTFISLYEWKRHPR